MGHVVDDLRKSGRVRAARRWGSASAVVLGAGLAVSLAACTGGGTDFTPKPVVTITPSGPSAPPSSPSEPATSATPASPSTTPSTPAVKATGSMAIFMTVSNALTGTCQTVSGAPTITLADHNNDFYEAVDAKVVLAADRKQAASVAVTFKEDQEGFHWELAYDSASPVKGTSAVVSASGNTYTISGKLNATETRKGKTITELKPFKITAKCASSNW